MKSEEKVEMSGRRFRFPRPALLFFIFSASIGFKQVLCGNDLSGFSFRNFKIIPGYSLIGNVTETGTFSGYLTCAFVCARNPWCLSFNFNGTSVESLFSCEFCNSLEVWDPQNLKKRPGFDFYQEVKDAVFLHPCLSSPCQNGGTCVEYKGNYTCECPLEIRAVPYIDNKCNIQMDLIKAGTSNSGVFHCRANGRYKVNFYEAERVCQLLGATLASYDQLYSAWLNGYEVCSYGWLTDVTLRYPMQKAAVGCGGRGIIRYYYQEAAGKANGDAYCYKSP